MNVMINDIPDEILVLIFSRFDLLEKLRLRLVCLRWKLIIETLRIKDVSIVDSYFNRSEIWRSSGIETLNYQNLIYANLLYQSKRSNPSLFQRLTDVLFNAIRPKDLLLTDSLRMVSQHQMFARLKSMFIGFESIENFFFEKYINPHFQQLEQLSCFHLTLGETCLNLVNLKTLSLFALWRLPGTRVRLELPSMYKFLTNLNLNPSSIEFANSQTVTHLFSPDDHESMARLSNLEYLSCTKLYHESATFSDLANLKEIHLGYKANEKERVAEIYEAKERLGRHELKMLICGVDYQTYRDPNFNFREFLGEKFSINGSIFYDSLVDTFGSQTLLNVKKISAFLETQNDVDLFFRLLDDYPKLYVLELEVLFDALSDGQVFYDSLPSRCRYLRELKLYESGDRITPSDLKFVIHFSYLQNLKLNQYVSSDFVESLFRKNLKYFQILELAESSPIKITKSENYFDRKPQKYRLSLNHGEEATFGDFSLLLLTVQLTCLASKITEQNLRSSENLKIDNDESFPN